MNNDEIRNVQSGGRSDGGGATEWVYRWDGEGVYITRNTNIWRFLFTPMSFLDGNASTRYFTSFIVGALTLSSTTNRIEGNNVTNKGSECL